MVAGLWNTVKGDIMGVLLIVLVVVFIIWFGGQATSTVNVKQEGRKNFEEQSRNIDAYNAKVSREGDYYQDPTTKWIDYNYYRDGSLRHENGKTYPKGKYKCNSHGHGPFAKEMPNSTPRPPKP